MVVVSVWYKLKPGCRESLMDAVRNNVEATRKEPGNIKYEHFKSVEDEQEMFVFEVWESKKYLEAHINAEHYLKFSEIRKPMLADKDSYRYTIYSVSGSVDGTRISTW